MKTLITTDQLEAFFQLQRQLGTGPERIQRLLEWPMADLLHIDMKCDEKNLPELRRAICLDPAGMPAPTSPIEMETTITTGQLVKILELQKQLGTDSHHFGHVLERAMKEVLHPQALFYRHNRDAFRKSVGLDPIGVPEKFEFDIDYTHLPKFEDWEMFTGCEFPEGVAELKKIPVEGSGKKRFEARLIPESESEVENILAKIRKIDPANPWSAGRFEHLMAFAAKYREVRRFAIYAIGSHSNGKLNGWPGWPYSCPILFYGTGRSIQIHNVIICSRYRVLIVREKKVL